MTIQQAEALRAVLEYIEKWNKGDDDKAVADAALLLEEFIRE